MRIVNLQPQGAESSQQMYETFLKRVGQLYSPDKVKGGFLLPRIAIVEVF
jgi:hypothetical protein